MQAVVAICHLFTHACFLSARSRTMGAVCFKRFKVLLPMPALDFMVHRIFLPRPRATSTIPTAMTSKSTNMAAVESRAKLCGGCRLKLAIFGHFCVQANGRFAFGLRAAVATSKLQSWSGAPSRRQM